MAMATEEYVVRRSARRRTTMGITREAGMLVVLVPERLTRAQERELVPGFVSRYLEREASRRPPAADAELTVRGRRLFARYLAEPGREVPRLQVSWSSRQRQRWGSCTIATGEIRLSDRLRSMPDWVADYVLVHELTHLIETDHTTRFHELVARYPQAERAKGFLEGWLSAQGLQPMEY